MRAARGSHRRDASYLRSRGTHVWSSHAGVDNRSLSYETASELPHAARWWASEAAQCGSSSATTSAWGVLKVRMARLWAG